METKNLVLIEQFCLHHQIDFSFIHALNEFGLIEVIVVENNQYLQHEQLKDVEKMMRLHYELNINLEGIDAIANLLNQINQLNQELMAAKNKLKFFEDNNEQ